MSLFPADPLPPLHRPPRPLPLWAARWPGWAQTALLPLSMLALLALPNTKQQQWEDTSQTRYKGRTDKQCLKAWHTLTFHTTCKENRGQPGELEEAFFKAIVFKKMTQNDEVCIHGAFHMTEVCVRGFCRSNSEFDLSMFVGIIVICEIVIFFKIVFLGNKS